MERGNYGGGRGAGGGCGGGRGGGRSGGDRGRGGGGGRRGGRGRGGRDGENQYQYQQQDSYHGGGGRRGDGGGANTPPAQAWGPRPSYGGQGGAYRPPPSDQGAVVGPTRSDSGGRGGGGRVAWGDAGRLVAIATGGGGGVSPNQPQRTAQPVSSSSVDAVIPDIQSLKVSEDLPQASHVQSTKGNRLPAERPDEGGKNGIWSINLLVNHFPVKFNSETTIIHYDVEIKPEQEKSFKGSPRSIPKSNLRMIKDKLFSDNPTRFPVSKTAYDGEKNIFSAIELPTGKFKVEFIDEDKKKGRAYIVSVTRVSELKLSKLKDYLSGNLVPIPRDILQGMDVVMKENPSRNNFSVGRSFYPRRWDASCELGGGNIALRGFQQSLKPTSQGLALCLDYTALAFRKPLPVLDYLKQHIHGFDVDNWIRWRDVNNVLRGLKVMVTHRRTKQKFTIAKLTEQNTCDISFLLEDPEGKLPPTEKIKLVKYFKDRYDKDITYEGIPCLDLGKNKKSNFVPMEFCVMVEGQRYPKELLDRRAEMALKGVSLPAPSDRKVRICEMIRAEDGPSGRDVARNFDIQVSQNMTKVAGRVIGAPELKVGAPNGNVTKIRVDNRCQWNLVGKSVVDGKLVGRWALLDFSSVDRAVWKRLNSDRFIFYLTKRCRNLGILMEDPVLVRFTGMSELSDIKRVRKLLETVIKDAKDPLQMIVCAMTERDPGYKYLKYISETEIGVVTQCCLSTNANKEDRGTDQYFANLALKINAKLGGSNVELSDRLPHFEGRDSVMFVGADVNHPGSMNSTCPSMAAVVATINWPAANRYAARVCPQIHRKEKILNFGDMCLDLVNTYEKLNNAKPDNIVVFRDGVSEGQFDMVLNEELVDMINKVCSGTYQPRISLIVAQKRHETRLFPQNLRDVDSKGNVPPGTVVDTIIVHPFNFDFYLCSHYGGLGTSKPTHYYVLWNEHNFNSDLLQKLIYDMCFTFARCTKPVSLVPPVYYADLVAYRGRMFQEVVMSLPRSDLALSSTSSNASASSLTSYDASFDEKFYKVHPELENIMFFV